MAFPTIITDDYLYKVGGSGVTFYTSNKLFTWAKCRTTVIASGLRATSYQFDNWGSHDLTYRTGPTPSGGYYFDAIESEQRLFRGTTYGAIGYGDQQDPDSPTEAYVFTFGTYTEYPPGSGTIVVSLGSGLDQDEESEILDGASFVGSANSVTVASSAYTGTRGQPYGMPYHGRISSVTLTF